MPETREARSVIDAAERAAAAGDYRSAEQLLREAALLQEADLGLLDPDLANTLNNLGVVCEITDKPADAELCYRKAYEIATAVLEPDHPFVATSRKNLNDFYKARGRAVESPTPSPADAAERESQATGSVTLPHAQLSPAESRRFPFNRPLRPRAIGALSVCGLVVVVLIATRPWFRANGRAQSSPVSMTQSVTESPARMREPVEPIAVPNEITTNNPPAGTEGTGARVVSVPSRPMLTSAQLCRVLSSGGSHGSSNDWRCTPPSRPVDSGSLFFYTRLKSVDDTTVQHRWYWDDRLYQVVNLRILANPSSGYRTYSRHTMNTRSTGNWRVELRTRDGILLREERFVVR